MLAYCLSDGLTCNMKVFRRGDIFVLPLTMENEYGDLSPSQLATKQRKIYRRELFRWPTDEEITGAYRAGDVDINTCSPREQLLVADKRGEDGVKLQQAAGVLRDKVLKDHPELNTDEEDAAEPVELVTSVTEASAPEPESPAKRTTTRKASSRKKKE